MISDGLKTIFERAIARRGYRLVRHQDPRTSPRDLDEDARQLFEQVRDYTLTTPERVAALRDAVRYVVLTGVPGAIVECGVFRGGSMMAVAHTLQAMGREDRELYLYDTFSGMPSPGERDVDIFGVSAADRRARYEKNPPPTESIPTMLQLLPLEDVRRLMLETGYPGYRMHFVTGLVEDTIPDEAPETIAVLRLDTDYYSSTRHEFVHLYPRVSDGGVVIIDDYGRWKGAREATDEYLAEQGLHALLHRIDTASRMIVVRRS